MNEPLDVKAIREQNAMARREVAALCKGTRKWTMCVPVQPDDSDVVLTDALIAGVYCLDVIKQMVKALDDCVADMTALGRAKDSDYSRPDEGIVASARAALALVKR